MREKNIQLWLRALALALLVLGGLFMVYGRLVAVETRLASLERSMDDLRDRILPALALRE